MCEECQKKQSTAVARKPANAGAASANHKGIERVLRSPGQPLDRAARAFFEPRFGRDFGNVRVHTDTSAADSAESIRALAYAAGPSIAFGRGQYQPGTFQGQSLIAHELAHVVQQEKSPGDSIRRVGDPNRAPMVLSCAIATENAPQPTDTVLFANDSYEITKANKAKIAAFVDNWKTLGKGATVRVDGFASNPGSEELNWQLSCNRAGAVKDELAHLSDGAGAGIPEGSIEVFMHGKTSEFGNEDLNRRVNLFMPEAAPVPPPKPKPTKPEPVKPEPEKPEPVKPDEPPAPRTDVPPAACAQNPDCSAIYCLPFPTRKEALDDRASHSGFVLNRISGLNAHARPLFDKFVFDPGPAGDISGQYAPDFSKDHVTLEMTKLLVGMLQTELNAHPPNIPAGAASVDVDINAALTKQKTDEVLDRDMIFSDPFTVPGLIAGGVGKTQVACQVGANTAGAQDDARHVQGTVNVIKNADGTLLLTPALIFTVIDTLDFCPGNCGGMIAAILTEPLSRWEASFISGDVPFSVRFPGASLVGAYDSEDE
jgi:outer membrane protein OmpA-like peptidoglycan-associated protein